MCYASLTLWFHVASAHSIYRCSLTTMAQDIPFLEIPLIRDCCNHKGSPSYLTIAAGISSSSFILISTRQLAVSSSTLKFYKSIGTEGTQNLQPLTPQVSTVSIELTWLLKRSTNHLYMMSRWHFIASMILQIWKYFAWSVGKKRRKKEPSSWSNDIAKVTLGIT